MNLCLVAWPNIANKLMFKEGFLSYLIVIPRWKKDWIDFDYFVIIRGQSMTDTIKNFEVLQVFANQVLKNRVILDQDRQQGVHGEHTTKL